jgi:hypothetical protein
MSQMERAMNLGTVGEIIATRQLFYFDDAQLKRTITAVVGKPHLSPGSLDFQCKFQIIGIGNPSAQTVRGRDSIEALQSALIQLAASLNHLNDQLGRKLTWEGGATGELGFP